MKQANRAKGEARISTRDEIIRKGAELIHANGYKATGIQQILDAVGIPKGSFYFYFRSKDDFGAAVIDYFASVVGEIFKSHLHDARLTPMKRLGKLLDTFETAGKKSKATLGCPIGNLSLELSDTNETLRSRLACVVEETIAEIESCLGDAQKSGELPAGIDVPDAARFIFHGLEGALLHMKVAKSIEPLRTFRRYLDAYLKR